MKQIIRNSLILLLSMITTACSVINEEPDDTIVALNDSDLKLVSMVEDFYKSVSGKGSRSTENNLIVDDIKSDYYRVTSWNMPEKIEFTETRASEDSMVFDISTVVFHIGKNKGYSLLSSHRKINRIFFFTENGELSDTSVNIILRDIFHDTPILGASLLSENGGDNGEDDDQDVIDPGENPGGGSGDGNGGGESNYLYVDTIKTKWGQGYPYNRYLKYCACNDCAKESYHMHAGCVSIATAQFIAKIGKFKGIFYANKNIQLNLINNKNEPSTPEEEEDVAFFVREVALGCQTQFNCNSSHSNPKASYHYLKDMGYDVSYHEDNMDMNVAKSCMYKGWPMILGGKKGSTGAGHVWILDGMKRSNGVTEFHCNWGWYGNSDGWIDSYYVAKPKLANGNIDERHYWYAKKQIYLNSND